MHDLIREQDEYYCTRCHKRWDVADEQPYCVSDFKAKRLNSIHQIQKLKRKLEGMKCRI